MTQDLKIQTFDHLKNKLNSGVTVLTEKPRHPRDQDLDDVYNTDLWQFNCVCGV